MFEKPLKVKKHVKTKCASQKKPNERGLVNKFPRFNGKHVQVLNKLNI
jgi:hypothetical protein